MARQKVIITVDVTIIKAVQTGVATHRFRNVSHAVEEALYQHLVRLELLDDDVASKQEKPTDDRRSRSYPTAAR